MKGIISLLAGILVLTVAGAASAADLDGSMKDPIPVAEGRSCGGKFAGAYIGAAIGYGDHDAKFNDELNGGSVDGDDGSVTFGAYGGYNIECDGVLFGIESDFNYMNTDADWSDCCYSLSSEMNWFGTLRGRLGFVRDHMLFYVTGGLAYADIDHTFAFPAGSFSRSDSDVEYGWTAGGGVEFMRDGNWSWRAEALYVDLGDTSENYQLTGCGFNCDARVGWEDDFWVGRVGVAYRFGAREEVVPLK